MAARYPAAKHPGSEDQEGAPTKSIDLDNDDEPNRIEPVGEAGAQARIETEAFMNEPVTVFVESGDDPNEPLFIETGNNGDQQYIQRGQNQTIKRRFVYSLIAAKVGKLSSSFGIGPEGKEFNRLTGQRKSTHRFYIVEDSAKGRAWFQKAMKEA